MDDTEKPISSVRCPACDGAGYIHVAAIPTPLLHALHQIGRTAELPPSAATLNALEENLKSFGQLIEKTDTIPVPFFAYLENGQRKIALLGLGHAILGSVLKRTIYSIPHRIITPHRDR